MFKTLKTLKVSNNFFNDEALEIFNKKDAKVSIIYGTNGQGKTTISRAFYKVKQPESMDLNGTVKLFNDLKEEIKIGTEDCNHIHVFNEDFIARELSFKSETISGKINSIVMLGNDIELTNTLDEKEKEINKIRNDISKLNIEQYNNESNTLSPNYFYKIIKKNITSNFLEEERIIKTRKSKTTFTDELFEKIIDFNSSEKFDKDDYEEIKANLLKIKNEDQYTIDDVSFQNINFSFEVSKITNLLLRSFNKPIGDELVERINKSLTDKKLSTLNEIKENINLVYCPYCFQKIDNNHANHVIDEINKLQSNEIKQHIVELEMVKIMPINFNLMSFERLNLNFVNSIKSKIIEINMEIENINNYIKEKISNPYDRIKVESDIDYKLEDLLIDIAELEKQRIKYNEDIKNIKKIELKLLDLNYIRFIEENKSIITSYKKQKKVQIDIVKENEKNLKSIEKINKEITELKAKSLNIGIALNKINEYLAFIYMSKSRLSLEHSENCYLIKRSNKPVSLKNLSNGEKNAIALAYFFTLINQNQNEINMFMKKSLIILDDPLSSFDQNNKIGIYAFLRRILKGIHENVDSRTIILTHQIETFFDINKVIDDINLKKYTGLLNEKKITELSVDKHNVYRITLKDIFKKINTPEENLTVEEMEEYGNKMRKVLESFSTFIYGSSIDKLSTNEKIINNMHPNPDVIAYFENSMYRISLNSTSHFKDRALEQYDKSIITYFDKNEILKSISDAMVLIYLLNPTHIKIMLGDDFNPVFFNNYIQNIVEFSEQVI